MVVWLFSKNFAYYRWVYEFSAYEGDEIACHLRTTHCISVTALLFFVSRVDFFVRAASFAFLSNYIKMRLRRGFAKNVPASINSDISGTLT